MDYYEQELHDLYKDFESSEEGLSSQEAEERIKTYGRNELKEKKKKSPILLFLSQFKDFIVIILIIATIISALVHEYADAIVIAIILIVNAILGFVQEYRAEKSIEALKKLAGLKATVLRDGKEEKIDSTLLVPGDVLILSTGEKVPADARIMEAYNLEIQESALTGESLPVRKVPVVLRNKQVSDQSNMIFSGTIITKGRGKAIVVKTGMQTEIGKIATMIQDTEDEETPLQKKLDELGKYLGIGALVLCGVIFAIGLIKGMGLLPIFLIAVSLAVAAVPEGLPAVVTITLAMGVQRMVARHALIRKLPSVETLGSTTVICTDKTGTLTCDQMTVKKVFVNNQIIGVSGEGYDFKGEFSSKENIELLLKIGLLCNDAKIEEKLVGDPTEGALIVSAAKHGMLKEDYHKKHPRVDEIPFDSERKLMTTVHRDGDMHVAYTKGAVDVILRLCDRINVDGKVERLTDVYKKRILEVNSDFANQALRVLGFAYKEVKHGKEKPEEKELIFVGLQAMMDPPRPEVKLAIEKCKKAGIKVVMITGDHKETAIAIAREIGLKGEALTGAELDKIDDLSKIVETVVVYARVNPEHKLKIVEALKKHGHVVAMTGDGVNDAPALKKADIGIAMGISGTDVAKEASKMILTDDNFASIVNAVEEGRGIYDNIKKFVKFLLSCNLGELLVIFTAILIGMPLPLVAIQILWMNLVTDGLPALALSVEPPEKGIMERKPRKKDEKILDIKSVFVLLMLGLIMTLGVLFLYNMFDPVNNWPLASTVAFTALVLFQMFNVLNWKSEEMNIFKAGVFSNIWLWLAILSSIGLQLLVIYTPLNVYFKTVPLGLIHWLWIIGVSAMIFIVYQVFVSFKWDRRAA